MAANKTSIKYQTNFSFEHRENSKVNQNEYGSKCWCWSYFGMFFKLQANVVLSELELIFVICIIVYSSQLALARNDIASQQATNDSYKQYQLATNDMASQLYHLCIMYITCRLCVQMATDGYIFISVIIEFSMGKYFLELECK